MRFQIQSPHVGLQAPPRLAPHSCLPFPPSVSATLASLTLFLEHSKLVPFQRLWTYLTCCLGSPPHMHGPPSCSGPAKDFPALPPFFCVSYLIFFLAFNAEWHAMYMFIDCLPLKYKPQESRAFWSPLYFQSLGGTSVHCIIWITL